MYLNSSQNLKKRFLWVDLNSSSILLKNWKCTLRISSTVCIWNLAYKMCLNKGRKLCFFTIRSSACWKIWCCSMCTKNMAKNWHHANKKNDHYPISLCNNTEFSVTLWRWLCACCLLLAVCIRHGRKSRVRSLAKKQIQHQIRESPWQTSIVLTYLYSNTD